MQSRVLVTLNRNALCHKVLLDQFRVIVDSSVEGGENDALALQCFVEFDMYDRGIALHNMTGAFIDQGLLFMQGLLNYRWKCAIDIGRDKRADLLKMKVRDSPECAEVATASQGRRKALVDVPGMEALLQHPLRLTLVMRQRCYRVAGQSSSQRVSH